MNSVPGVESPKKNPSAELRQLAGKRVIESKEFFDTLKSLTNTKHSLLLQCILETLNAIPNMYFINKKI